MRGGISEKRVIILIISLAVISILGVTYYYGIRSKKVTDASTTMNLLRTQVTTGDIEISTSGATVTMQVDALSFE